MGEHQHAITVGRYLLHRKIARGGMATIHIARLMGDVGFSRIVAAKRMHPELAEDAEFVAMFLDEARIASKVNHRNVVPVLDVVTMGTEVMLVQEYVHGAPLSLLLRNSCEARGHVPIPVAASIACQVLAGLHAAHETVDEMGVPLHVVHRDVSPQNIMVATDGTARLLDFGVAKAALAAHVTRKGTFKGKLGYSSPEQIRGEATKQSDIYSLAVVLWELLVGHRLHGSTHGEAQLVAEIMGGHLPTVTDALADDRAFIGPYRWSQLEVLEPIIRKGLDVNSRRRWATAVDMEEAIGAAVPIAPASDVAAWLKAVGKEYIEDRERLIAEEEASWRRRSNGPVRVDTTSLEVPLSTATEPDATHSRPFRGLAIAILMALVMCFGMGIAFLVRDLENTAAPAPTVAAKPAPDPAPLPAAAPLARNDVTIAKPVEKHAKAAMSPARSQPAAGTAKPQTLAATPPQTAATAAPQPLAAAAGKPQTTTATSAPQSMTAAAGKPQTPQTTAPQTTDGKPQTTPAVASAKPQTTSTTTDAATTTKAQTTAIAKPAAPKPEASTSATAKKRAAKPAPSRSTPPSRTPSTSSSKGSAAALDCSTPFYFEGRKKIFKSGCL